MNTFHLNTPTLTSISLNPCYTSIAGEEKHNEDTTMKKLLSGEAGNRSTVINVETKTAAVTHCWKRDRNSTRYQLNFNYSFDVEPEEVYRFAALWVNKDYQNRMRAESYSEKELAAIEQSTISVKGMYAKKERGPHDPKKAAESALSKLSKEEVEAILSKFSES